MMNGSQDMWRTAMFTSYRQTFSVIDDVATMPPFGQIAPHLLRSCPPKVVVWAQSVQGLWLLFYFIFFKALQTASKQTLRQNCVWCQKSGKVTFSNVVQICRWRSEKKKPQMWTDIVARFWRKLVRLIWQILWTQARLKKMCYWPLLSLKLL